MILFTSSWDDGSVYDLKLYELLLKYNQKATFFIPLANEKRRIINLAQIVDISKEFEMGSHTLNHKYLTEIPDKEAEYEITQSKNVLETIIEKPVYGFCFPGGKFRPVHLDYVKQAGYRYARTVNMFKMSGNSILMDTTLQACNHSKNTYFKHLLKRGYFTELFNNSIPILKNNDWNQLLTSILDKQLKSDSPGKLSIIHLWGHSYELQANKSWNQLEQWFRCLNSYGIISKTNYEIFKLQHQSQNTTIHNKSLQIV